LCTQFTLLSESSRQSGKLCCPHSSKYRVCLFIVYNKIFLIHLPLSLLCAFAVFYTYTVVLMTILKMSFFCSLYKFVSNTRFCRATDLQYWFLRSCMLHIPGLLILLLPLLKLIIIIIITITLIPLAANTLTYLVAILLTPWSRVLLEKLTSKI